MFIQDGDPHAIDRVEERLPAANAEPCRDRVGFSCAVVLEKLRIGQKTAG
jgi:hypothetical protein